MTLVDNKEKYHWDLPIIVISTILLFLFMNTFSTFGERLIIISPILFFYPGYLLISIFSEDHKIRYRNRLIFSFPLSILLLIVSGILLFLVMSFASSNYAYSHRFFFYTQPLLVFSLVIILILKRRLGVKRDSSIQTSMIKEKVEVVKTSFIHPFIPPRLKDSLKKIEEDLESSNEKED